MFFLVDKSDVFATFKAFIKRIHNEFKTTIKKVRSNNGSEFKNTRVDELCDKFRIRHQFLVKYTPICTKIWKKNRRGLKSSQDHVIKESIACRLESADLNTTLESAFFR